MKKVMMLMMLVMGTLAVQAQSDSHFGKEINESKAIEASALPEKMGDKKEMAAKVSGQVESVCQVKGCWMAVKLDNGETMRVMFKDYAFFVPKDITGKTVVFEGQAQKKTIPVEHLQHYAKDAGQSQEEIAKITEPKDELTFIADGVIVK
ncbi:DUF4920 domain-containing protein [Dyadobacter chenwenxiniae]|uniref:DUF4920 domain-containing protein n=1 Tax=Dyadobacter chenwenxiniae TaxID=2906456 RepID=A0A9X1TI13_9BACT|nr:DUF4920 domain-containing protein [Dyadobacter chenwenxiniae]MCF0065034.1 DUF4920 domain-containing protein [Dyadobacter chenwenxiniae]UON83150.1 DUF4920 domain-containing protein [Dyadobacter chenwenxiniae]